MEGNGNAKKQQMTALRTKYKETVKKYKTERDTTVEIARQYTKTRETADTNNTQRDEILKEYTAARLAANTVYLSSVAMAKIELKTALSGL